MTNIEIEEVYMKQEAKRILSEIEVLQKTGIVVSKEVVTMLTNKDSYWYIVFQNTKNFKESMTELYNEAM